MRSTKRTHMAKSVGALGLLGLLQGGACAVPDRGDPPAPDVATAADTSGTAGEVSGDSETDEPTVSYAESIHPLQMTMCAPACHATGAGGFTIAGNVEADLQATLQRVSLAAPEDSKLLKKVSGDAAHQGGPLLPAGSEGYELILDWIAQGANP